MEKRYENGIRISIRGEAIRRPVPGIEAHHEAAHVIAAGNIIYASIRRSGNTGGVTIPEKLTLGAAGAGAAVGDYSGARGHDLPLASWLFGATEEEAIAAGNKDLKGKEKVRYEVATLLQERTDITQDDVNEAHENVKKEEKGIFSATIDIISPEGKTTSYQTESFREQVLIPGEWLNLLQVAK